MTTECYLYQTAVKGFNFAIKFYQENELCRDRNDILSTYDRVPIYQPHKCLMNGHAWLIHKSCYEYLHYVPGNMYTGWLRFGWLGWGQ